MKTGTLTYVGSVVFLGTLIFMVKATAEQPLGQFPLCEASAAVILPCPDAQGECLLVGDNEQRKDLFLFTIQDGAVNAESQKALNLQLTDKKELSDIEALARISTDEVLIFGSHSRNTKCQATGKRRQFATVRITKDGASISHRVESKKIKCKRLFGEISPGDSVLTAACETIDSTEKEAQKLNDGLGDHELTEDQEKQAKERCNEITPFNAEGAVVVSGTEGTKVWIGLRAPLLPTPPDQPEHKNLAMLLRMKNLESYEFDKVALLDLDGRGVRELAFAEDSIWVIAGPPEDKKEPFQLLRFAKDDLGSGEVIKPELVDTLPTSSEGLAVAGKTAYVVIDGDKGDDKNATHCKEPSKYKEISLP